MAINTIQGYAPSTTEPIDSRIIKANASARLAIPTFDAYKGLLVYQQDTGELYVCNNPSNPALEASWAKIFTSTGTSGSYTGSFQGDGSGLTNVPASGIVGLNLSRTATGSVSASVDVGTNSFTLVSSSINLLTVNNQGLVSASVFSGSFQGPSTGSFTGIGSGSFSGSFQGDGNGLTNIPASGIVGLNLSLVSTGSVTAATLPDSTVFKVTSASIDLLTLDNLGNLTVSGSEVIGNHITAKGNATITGSLAVNGITTLNSNLIVNTSSSLRDTTVTGSMLVTQNLTVLGTASFTRVTGSEIIVGASTITLNTDDPVVRFGGLIVIDSGSFGTDSTGSLLWDSERNHWIYANPSGSSYDGGGLMSGPRNSAGLGNETYPDKYSILRGQGGDHLEGSPIYSSGSNLTINKGTTGSIDGVEIYGSVLITGSTLLPTPSAINVTSSVREGEYALSVSQSAWFYNHNAGVPRSNAWKNKLNGSYFNNFDSNTNVSEILRFIAGLLSSSAPDASPNTRYYNSINNNNPSLSNSSISGYVPQDISGSDLIYLNSKGFANTGSTIFDGVGTVYTTLNPTYTFTSVADGTTNVSSSADAQLFGLGTIGTAFNVSGALNWRFDDNFAQIVTATSSSQAFLTRSTIGASSPGLSIGEIRTVNPDVIPNAYQDGKFNNIFGMTFYTGSRSATSVSSSGWYHISASIGVQSGSSNYSSFKNNFTKVFAAPISNIAIPTQTITFTQSVTPLTATSRSLSGAPYLQTATWNFQVTSSGVFEPLYFGNSTIFDITDNSTLVTPTGTSTQAMSAGNISGTSLVYNSTGATQRSTSTVPFRTDRIQTSLTETFTAGTTDENINETGLGTTSYTVTSTSYNRSGGTSTTSSVILFHSASTFGQPLASGSMAYYGRAQGGDGGTYSLSSGNLIVNFTGESRRLQITDRLLSGSYSAGDAWSTTFGLYNLGTSDLQIKPGFLVKPTGSGGYGYWLNDPDTSGTAANLKKKYAAFGFTRNTTGNQPNITMTLAGNTSLSAWTVENPDTISILIIPQSVLGTVSQASGIDPVAAATTTAIGAGTATNPFGRTLTVLANSNPQKTNPFIVDFPTSPNPFPLNGTYQNFVVLVRYIGNPVPLTSITLAVS